MEEAIWSKVKDFATFPATHDTRQELLTAVPLPSIIGLLADSAKIDIVCRCLSKLLGDTDEGSEILMSEQGLQLLHSGLGHPHKTVRKTTVDLVGGLSRTESGMQCLHKQDLVQKLLLALYDNELTVSNSASSAILTIVQRPLGVSIVFGDSAQVLSGLLTDRENATQQLRGLELVAKIWSINAECAEQCRASGVKQELVQLLDSDDMLLQLNAVEILSLLPPQDVGEDLMLKILSTAEALPGGAVPARLLECVARFLADLPTGEGSPPVKQLEAHMTRVLHDRIESALAAGSNDHSDTLSAVSTLCSTPSGFIVLARSREYPQIVSSLPALIQSLHGPTRLAALSAVVSAVSSMVLVLPKDVPDHDDRGGVLGRQMVSVLPFLMKLANSPIQEERVAALYALRSLSQHGFGLQAMFSAGDFFAYVTNRSIEPCKLALEQKYQIVVSATKYLQINDLIGNERASMLNTFVRDGPYYTGKGPGNRPDAVPIVATKNM